MLNIIQNAVSESIPGKTKVSNDWTTFNAPCCPHNGEGTDKKKRGHIKFENDGSVIYGCFNCGYKTAYIPGNPITFKFRKLLTWMGASENTINRLVLEAMREREKFILLGKTIPKKEELKIKFKKKSLPPEAVNFYALVEFYELKHAHDADQFGYPKGFVDAVSYVSNRSIDMRKYEFMWSTSTTNKMDKRVIIPFHWKNEVIGYSARAIDDNIKPKYFMEVDEGFVFNVDKQKEDSQFVIVCEGLFDAMAIDGVAVLHNEVSKKQVDIIESLDKDIIVVPDFDMAGNKLIDCAVENGWGVSFPVWAEHCKDVNDAVVKYGKLFVLKAIIDSVQRSKIKIQLMRKKFI